MLFDIRSEGILDLTHEYVFKNRRGDIDRPDDLKHAVDVFLRIGHENGVCTLEHLKETFRGLESLKGLLRLIHRNILEDDHLTHDASLLGKVALVVHPEGDTVRTDRLARQCAKEFLPSRLKHHAVHREGHFNRFEVLLLRKGLPLKRTESDGGFRKIRGGNDGFSDFGGIRFENKIDRRLVERESGNAVSSTGNALQVVARHLRLSLLLCGRCSWLVALRSVAVQQAVAQSLRRRHARHHHHENRQKAFHRISFHILISPLPLPISHYSSSASPRI